MAYQEFTLAQMKVLLAQKWESTPYWSAEEARIHLNKALASWNMFTGFWKTRVSVVTTAGVPWVPPVIPSSLFAGTLYCLRWEFTSGAGTFQMEQGSISSLDNGHPGWEGESSTSGGDVPTLPRVWAPAGLRLFAFWPADAAGGNTFTIDAVAKAPILVNDTDFIDIGSAELNNILGEALHTATFKEGSERFTATQDYHRQFLMACAENNSRLKASQFFRRYMGIDVNRGERVIRGVPTLMDQKG